MINVSYDQEHNTVIIEFVGKIDAAQGEQYLPDIPKVLPKHGKGFTLLVDLSAAESIDSEIRGSIKKAMDLINAQGVTKIIRVIPNPDQDIGFNIMSLFHYSSSVKIVTLPSREMAKKHLQNERGPVRSFSS